MTSFRSGARPAPIAVATARSSGATSGCAASGRAGRVTCSTDALSA
jgi:hypothetical protein